MHRLLLKLPTGMETERLYLRGYQAGDGPWYYRMSQANRQHLERYEADNPARGLQSEEEAEILVRDFAAAWVARQAFFLGVFRRTDQVFVAQIYIGAVNWALPEFQIGYFVDVNHEGQGYVTEAVGASLGFIFRDLQAHRVRLECDDTNRRSIGVAERCGLIREGHLRETKRNADGSFSGSLTYGLLRQEFVRQAAIDESKERV
jgi:RimJ/RimL family protein N-acetyltransferase